MTIRVLTWSADTFQHEIGDIRPQGKDIVTHALERVEWRLNSIIKQLAVALESYDSRWEHTFFVLPEFYWNTRWSNVWNEQEIQELCAFYLNKIPEVVNRLIDRFPPVPGNRASNITFLCGTCAVLYTDPQQNAMNPDVGGFFQAINWLLCGHNTRDCKDSLSSWQKRYISRIDYFPALPEAPFPGYISQNLGNNNVIHVKSVTDLSSASLTQGTMTDYFINTYADNKKFSIDICLDYLMRQKNSEGSWPLRKQELESLDSNIDFLIACGMPLTPQNTNLNQIHYFVRNDGMPRQDLAQCEAWSSTADGNDVVMGDVLTDNIIQFIL